MIINHLEARIRSGKPSFGALLSFGDPLVAEMMASAPLLEPPHEEFEEAMQIVLRTAKKHGVAAGIHCATPATVNRRIAEGWLMTGMVNDQRLLQSAAQAARAAVKTPDH